MDSDHKFNPCLELKQKSLECQVTNFQDRDACAALMREYLSCRKRWRNGIWRLRMAGRDELDYGDPQIPATQEAANTATPTTQPQTASAATAATASSATQTSPAATQKHS